MEPSVVDNSAPPADLLRGRDMLCFSHDWSADPLSKTHLMRLMARENRVLWVNSIGYRAPTATRRDISRAARKLLAAAAPIRETEPNIHVLNPLIIPSYGRPWVRKFNRWFLRCQVLGAMKCLRFQRPVNWIFNPAAAIVAGSLNEDLLIYYCVDEYPAFCDVCGESIADMERELLAKAHVVFASSGRLYESKRRHNQTTALIRHGVDWSHFRSALDADLPKPPDLARLQGPILGYFGLIARDWVDLELIAHVARRMPHASIVMLGKITMDVSPLKKFPNVHLLGHRPYQALPAYCRGFDVALIPFPISEVTLNANPLKAREYLAAGLPVVSTAIPEVEVLGTCRIGRDHDGFVEQIQAALTEPGPAHDRSESVRHQSWEARIDEIKAHVADVVLPARPRSFQSTSRQQAA